MFVAHMDRIMHNIFFQTLAGALRQISSCFQCAVDCDKTADFDVLGDTSYVKICIGFSLPVCRFVKGENLHTILSCLK